MESGYGLVGIESLTFGAPDYGNSGHQSVNMNQNRFNDVRYHSFGMPSTSPPGTTNYVYAQGVIRVSPHSVACYVTTSGFNGGSSSVRAIGRC